MAGRRSETDKLADWRSGRQTQSGTARSGSEGSSVSAGGVVPAFAAVRRRLVSSANWSVVTTIARRCQMQIFWQPLPVAVLP